MASYDKPKLLALLERRRAHYVSARDVRARYSDATDNVNRWRNTIRAASRGLRPAAESQVEALLQMPLAAALGESRESVGTLIDWTSWGELLRARARQERLGTEQERMREVGGQFAIVPELLEAVRKWGFRDPELEVL
jgi:hypothetical protein